MISYMNMLVPIVLVVGTKDCSQTNYGDVVKFIAVPSSTCVNFWLVHVHYITCTFHCSLIWYVHKGIVYQQIMMIMSSQHSWNIAVNVVRLYPCTKCGESLALVPGLPRTFCAHFNYVRVENFATHN